MQNLVKEIDGLRRQRNAVILAHNYQRPEVQDIADFVGDSLELAQISTKTDAEIVIMCGVYFMAETAAIICPDKKVLVPDRRADCPMARMIDAAAVRELKEKYPQAAVVCYVNSTAEVKAESHICCTSSNAQRVIGSLRDFQQIIFVPDKNLGSLLARTSDKEFIFVDGYCPIHEKLSLASLAKMKEMWQDAVILAHGECNQFVRQRADKVLSTGQMCSFIRNSDRKDFIIATETDILHRMRKENPGKNVYAADEGAICADMKLTTLRKIRDVLAEGRNEVKVKKEIADRARLAIERMLAVG